MARPEDVKKALTFPADTRNPIGISSGKTVGDAALSRAAAALEKEYSLGRTATPDDVARWLYRQLRSLVLRVERREQENALATPPEFEG